MKIFTLIIISLFTLTCVSAIGNNIPIQIQTTDESGNIETGTYEFTINISNSSTCSPVLYSNISTKTTDNRGIVSYDIIVDLDFSEQYYLCFYRDGVSKINKTIGTNPYTFRANVSDYHNPLNNITAPYFFGDGSQLTGLAGGGDINGVTTNGQYLSGGADSGVADLLFNETKLNLTIDSRGGGDTWWGLISGYIYNNSNSLDFNETKLNLTIDDRDSDTTYTNGTGISLVGTVFSVTLSYFQGLFLELSGGTMTGDLNMGGNSIENVNTINITNNTYIHNLKSYDGNSINIQPTGDEDDFFSFKTLVDRPTIKREGGKFIYFESSNVYDVGISFRDDDTYSGTLAYAKDDNIFKLLGKASPVAIIPNSEYANYILFETFNHEPQISVFNGTELKVNDSLKVIGDVNTTGNFIGNGSLLTGITLSESDPLWSANQSSYSTTVEIIGFNYWNSTWAEFNKTYADTLYADIGVTGDNSSWNQSLADTLYADISVTGDDTSWNKTYADTLYTTTTYVDNLVSSVGNWTNDKSDYWNISLDLDFSTDLNTTGNITADYLLGDGSQLSNLPAGTTYSHLTNFTDDILWTSSFNSTFDARDSDTTYLASTGLNLNGSNYFNILTEYQMPQSCNDGEIAEYNTTSGGWDCGVDNTAASGMASWVLAALGIGGSESITDGETVTLGSGNDYIDISRSTNNINYTFNETKMTDATDLLYIKINGETNNITTTGNITADVFYGDVKIDTINGQTYHYLQDWIDITQSAGKVSGGTFTSNGDGTVNISTGTGFIKVSDSATANTILFDWDTNTSVPLTDNTTNYIYVDYNSGSPMVKSSTSKVNNRDKILLGKIFREGTVLHAYEAGMLIAELGKNTLGRFTSVDGEFTRASGLILSETGVLNIAMTSGVAWGGLTMVNIAEFNSSTTTFEYYYYDGADWQKSDRNQINNSHYNDIASGLIELTTNRYGVHWVYVDNDGHIMVVYGQGDYTLALATASQPPSDLPAHVTDFGELIGRIIVQKGDSTFTNVDIPSEFVFTSTGATDYNSLSNTPDSLSDFIDDLGDRGYTSNLNFTNDASYYNSSDFVITDYALDSKVDSLGNYSGENDTIARIGDCPSGQFVQNTTTGGVECLAPTLSESDPLAYNGTLAYLSDILGFNYYNSSDFSISDYFTKTNILSFNYWNDTFATFNKTYADTLYADISVTGDDTSWNKTYADTLYADISVVDTTDGNASSICADGEFLNGDGTCDAGFLDADGSDADTIYTNGTGLSLVGTVFSLIGTIFSGSWNDLTDVPSGFADGIDNNTGGDLTHLTNFTDDIGVSADWDEISDITADGITDTQLEYNTGQHLTTTSNPTFNNVTVSDCVIGGNGATLCFV